MAGEQKGKAYEALTKLVLEDLKAEAKIKGRIFWDEKPDTMTIVPDLTIGRSANAPDICILITHSGSAKESEKKLWRNMGELVEAKVFLPAQPLVFNLGFDSVVKANLKKVQEASFDGQLVVGDRPYGDELQAWIDANLKDFPKDKEEKVEHLREVAKRDKELKRLIGLLRTDLEALLKKKSPRELDEIWEMERKRKKGTAPARKETFVRRGLSKLLIFEDVDVALRLYSGQRVKQDEVPEYAYELGLATKAVGRAQPADTELQNAVTLLTENAIRDVCHKAPLEMMNRWIYPLRSLGDLPSLYAYITSNISSLNDPARLLAALQSVHRDPNSLLNGGLTLQTNWLYFLLVDLLKAASTLAQGFGYAQLLQKIKADILGVNRFLKREKLEPIVLRGQSFIVRGLTDWLGRLNTQQAKSFSQSFQGAVAYILAGELSKLNTKNLPDLPTLREKVIQTNLEQKLLTYREFQPLEALIKEKTKTAVKRKVSSCFAERAGAQRGGGETAVIIHKSTIINWQSCSDAGRDHKKKELCGRASSLRYSWDATNKRFIPRPGVKKLILVIDGTWRQADLDSLVRSGWDEIFYPDEMDKLAEAIV